jgi:hypothetical protein
LAQKLAKHKELRWEEQHVQSVVLQSVLQGESLEQTAKRFTQLTEMNYRQSVRYARTATTGAQNAGRVDGYKRAEKLGVNMKQVWLSTLDSRTRHEHRVLDGQEVDVGEPFIMDGFKIKYPGDPAAPAHLLFNCRCTVIAKVKGVDFDVSDKTQRDDKIGDMTYEEWKEEKRKQDEGEKKTEQPKLAPQKEEKQKANPVERIQKVLSEAHDYHITKNNLRAVSSAERGIDSFEVRLTKMDEAFKDSLVEQIESLTSRYDTPLERIVPMDKLEYTLSKENTFATTTHNYEVDTSMIRYNPVKIADVERVKELIRNGYAVQIPEEMADKYIITHEFAHTLINTGEKLNKNRNWVEADYKQIEFIRKETTTLYDEYIKEVGELDKARKAAEFEAMMSDDPKLWKKAAELSKEFKSKQISGYSMTNPDDFMAECFVSSELGGAQNDYVDRMMKIINKHFKR